MICVAQSSNDSYSQRLAKTRANVLNNLYGKMKLRDYLQQIKKN